MILIFIKIISLIVQMVLVLTNIVGLPGNIIAIFIPLMWFFAGDITLWGLFILVIIIAMGEIFEFYTGFIIGHAYGIDNKSLILGFIGAILLGIIMAPLFFGVGAVVGSFAGAYMGVFIYECVVYKNFSKASKRAVIVFKSRFMGTMIKFVLGIFMVVLTTIFIF